MKRPGHEFPRQARLFGRFPELMIRHPAGARKWKLGMANAVMTPRVRIMASCDAVRETRIEAGVFPLRGLRQQIVADRRR